jgi:hypothetical protein
MHNASLDGYHCITISCILLKLRAWVQIADTAQLYLLVFWTRVHFKMPLIVAAVVRCPEIKLLCSAEQQKRHFVFNPLTPELNPSAQHRLTRFFTGDFASWPCISLIYASKINKCNTYSFSLLIMYGIAYMFRHYIVILRDRHAPRH